MRTLSKILSKFVQIGQLTIFDAKGRKHVHGGKVDGPKAALRFHSTKLPYTLLLDPELKAAEAYMDGAITMESGFTLNDLVAVFMANEGVLTEHPLQRILTFMKEGIRGAALA